MTNHKCFFFTKVSSLDPGIESKPNIPELKQWNYDTSTNIHHDYKINAMDPIQKSTKLNVDQIQYIMPHFEKVQYIIIHQSFSMYKNIL